MLAVNLESTIFSPRDLSLHISYVYVYILYKVLSALVGRVELILLLYRATAEEWRDDAIIIKTSNTKVSRSHPLEENILLLLLYIKNDYDQARNLSLIIHSRS